MPDSSILRCWSNSTWIRNYHIQSLYITKVRLSLLRSSAKEAKNRGCSLWLSNSATEPTKPVLPTHSLAEMNMVRSLLHFHKILTASEPHFGASPTYLHQWASWACWCETSQREVLSAEGRHRLPFKGETSWPQQQNYSYSVSLDLYPQRHDRFYSGWAGTRLNSRNVDQNSAKQSSFIKEFALLFC